MVTSPLLLSLVVGSFQVRITAEPRGPENCCWFGGHPLVNLGGSTSGTFTSAWTTLHSGGNVEKAASPNLISQGAWCAVNGC